jgi:glycerol-3-phosphate acyltransferase PlsY
MTVQSWAVLVGAFLLGAFPTAYLTTRIVARVDIRTVGDGNVGALNTYRSVGRLAGILVGAIDLGKGAGAIVLARAVGEPEAMVRAAGVCAVLGHDFTPFLRFRGGQGMAAILGVLGLLYPGEIAAALVIAALTLAISHNWDLSWGVALGIFALSLWFTDHTTAEAIYPVFLLPTIGLSKLVQVLQSRGRVNGLAQ